MHEPRVAYTLYTAADAEEMVCLLGGVFASHEPPAVAMGITAGEFAAFVRLLCPNAASAELTFVARSAETGEMLGALVTEDAAAPASEAMHHLGAKFDPIS